MRPRSAASLPVSTASTGLLCLSVGARVHHGKSNIEVECVATTARIPHLVRDTYISSLWNTLERKPLFFKFTWNFGST